MANEFLEWVAGTRQESNGARGHGYSITPGIVTNNLDLIAEGRVQVRIPALPAFKPWARLAAAGGGSSRGFLWVPEIDDEVLVAFNQNDERDAYILGGLWSTLTRPPVTLPTDFVIKRVIKTGKAGGIGHEVEFDDALQSITITTSTKQKIVLDPKQIEISTTLGTVKVTLDLPTQKVSIEAPQIEIGGEKTLSIKLNAKKIEVGNATTALTTIKGQMVMIN